MELRGHIAVGRAEVSIKSCYSASRTTRPQLSFAASRVNGRCKALDAASNSVFCYGNSRGERDRETHPQPTYVRSVIAVTAIARDEMAGSYGGSNRPGREPSLWSAPSLVARMSGAKSGNDSATCSLLPHFASAPCGLQVARAPRPISAVGRAAAADGTDDHRRRREPRHYRAGQTFSLTSAIVFALYVVITVAAITTSDYLNIRPLIRDLSRSPRKVGYADVVTSQGQAMSAPTIAIFASLFVVATASNTYQALTSASGGWMAAVSAAGFALFALAFVSMLVIKLRHRFAS